MQWCLICETLHTVSIPFRALCAFLTQQLIPEAIEFEFESQYPSGIMCFLTRCGRALTDPKSIGLNTLPGHYVLSDLSVTCKTGPTEYKSQYPSGHYVLSDDFDSAG